MDTLGIVRGSSFSRQNWFSRAKLAPAVPQNEIVGRKLHAIVYSLPFLGHLQPLLHLSATLAECGHRVTVCVAACWRDKLAQQVAEIGCEMHCLPSDHLTDEYLQTNDFSFTEMTAWEYAPLLAFASTEHGTPDVIISDMFSLASHRVAQTMGVPHVVNAPAPMAFVSMIMLAANPVARSIAECLYHCGMPPFDPEMPSFNPAMVAMIGVNPKPQPPKPQPPNPKPQTPNFKP